MTFNMQNIKLNLRHDLYITNDININIIEINCNNDYKEVFFELEKNNNKIKLLATKKHCEIIWKLNWNSLI